VVQLTKGRSQSVGKTLTTFVDVLVTPGLGRAVWIGAGGENDSPSFAVVIPRDQTVATPVRLDIAFEEKHTGQWTMTAMNARLHDLMGAPRDVRRVWANLWKVQRAENLSNLSHAGMLVRDREVLEAALRDKLQSPVAAAIATTVLIRCGAMAQLYERPRNLADWFPALPDGAALWAETLLQRHSVASPTKLTARDCAAVPSANPLLSEDRKEMRRLFEEPAYEEASSYFAMLAHRGPPLLASTLVMAMQREKLFRCMVETQAVTREPRDALKDACESVRRAAKYSVCGGVFAAFATRAGQLSPSTVLGQRQYGEQSPSTRSLL
jgi:hypothetical protein